MGRPSKAVLELRAKYGLTQPVHAEVSCTHARSNAHRRINEKSTTLLLLNDDDLHLIVIALRGAATITDRDDLKPRYLDVAKRIEQYRKGDLVWSGN